MRILLLSHFFPPEMGGAVSRIFGLSRELVRAGHQVTVITGFPNYPTGVVAEGYRGRCYLREEVEGIEILRTWVYATPKRGSLRRLANYFSFVGSSTLAGFLPNRHFDVVIASSPPLFLGLAGWAISLARRIPFVFDIRDIWPEVAVEAGEFRADQAIVKWGERLERWLYRRAKRVVVVTDSKREKLLAKGVPADKIDVVANGVDLDLLVPTAPSDLRQQLGLQGKFIVVYAGLLGVFQGLHLVVDAARELAGNPQVHFLIIGDGVKRAELAERVAQEKLTNVTMMPPQPRESIPGILDTCNAVLVPLVSAQLVDAVPSKLLEAWGCRKPVILVAGGEARKHCDQSQGGISVEPGDTAALVSAVETLSGDPARVQACADAGYRYVSSRYDRTILARQMEQSLARAVGVELPDRATPESASLAPRSDRAAATAGEGDTALTAPEQAS